MPPSDDDSRDRDAVDDPGGDDERPDADELEARLPLLALDDAVCFPGTVLVTTVSDDGGRSLVREMMRRDAGERWLGIVLSLPGGGRDPFGRREVFPGGTAGRVIEARHDDGDALVVLGGEFRFEISRQVPGAAPYRRAVIRPLGEVSLDDEDPGVQQLRTRLLDLVHGLLPELGESVTLDLDAGLDLPALRKLELLLAALPQRGEALVSILENRRSVLDRLRPWRHLAAHPELN
jgi:Lon protease-like protein